MKHLENIFSQKREKRQEWSQSQSLLWHRGVLWCGNPREEFVYYGLHPCLNPSVSDVMYYGVYNLRCL